MVGVMDEVASGAKLAVLVLVIVAAHLLPQNWLVLHQLFDSVSEKAILSVSAQPCLCVTLAQL